LRAGSRIMTGEGGNFKGGEKYDEGDKGNILD